MGSFTSRWSFRMTRCAQSFDAQLPAFCQFRFQRDGVVHIFSFTAPVTPLFGKVAKWKSANLAAVANLR
jgi:hypothetical protein